MNLRYLEIMEAIVETGTFTGGAKKLFLTQSAVSHAIAELEKQTGTMLFERLPRGAVLTRCGRLLLEEAEGVLSASRDFDRRIVHLEENTPIAIVSSITIASFLLPEILNRFQQVAPGIKVIVRVASATMALDILKRGEADLAFWEGIAPKSCFTSQALGTYRLCAACSPDFLPQHHSLSAEQLCRYPLLLREEGSAIRDTFDHALALAGQRAVPVWESVNSQALVKAAEAGLGIVILPEKLLLDSVSLNRLRFITLDELEMENQMLALFYKDKFRTKPFQLLLDLLQFLKN